MSSRQESKYLACRSEGLSPNDAAFEVGIPDAEVRLIEQALASGELSLPAPTISPPLLHDPTAAGGSSRAHVAGDGQRSKRNARGDGSNTAKHGPGGKPLKETETMARPRKVEQVEDVHAPDFDLAVSIYRKDIKPAASKVGEHAQEMSEAYKAIKKRANIQPQAAKLAFRLDDMEESKRDDFLRSLNGLLKRLNIFMPVDLVDAAEGKGDVADDVIPTGKSRKPKLVTVPSHPADDSDLVEAAE